MRAESFSAALVLMVPKVMTWATRSLPPLVGGVAHHLAAATVVEVDVDIGHRRALGVEEPLEQQAVLDRVDVGDAAARRPPASRPPSRGPGPTRMSTDRA